MSTVWNLVNADFCFNLVNADCLERGECRFLFYLGECRLFGTW